MVASVRGSFFVCVVLAAGVIAVPRLAEAGRGGSGGGGSSPVTGRVFMSYSGGVYAANPANSSKTGPFPSGDPSNNVYSGLRWFVTTVVDESQGYPLYAIDPDGTRHEGSAPRVEIVAYAADEATGMVVGHVDITNFFVPLATGAVINPSWATWANANDGFISFTATEYTAEADGWINVSSARPQFYRLDVSGLTLAAGLPMPCIADDAELVFADLRMFGGSVNGWDWTKTANLASPGGERLAWSQSASTGSELRVREADGSIATIVAGPQFTAYEPRWCTDATMQNLIAYGGNVPSKSLILRGIWKVQAMPGAKPTSVIESTGTNYYANPEWSPTGGLLAIQQRVDRIENDEYDIITVDPSGRNKTSLTAELPKNQGKSLIRWTN